MSTVNCKNLRYFVILAAAVFLQGWILQLPRVLVADYGTFVILLSGMGLFAVLLSSAALVVAGLFSLMPGVSRRLNLCNH